MTRGFAIITNNTGSDRAKVARLMGYGIDRIEMVEVAEDVKARFAEVAKLLGAGDKLVVCSLCDICHGVDELMEVLLVLSRRKFVLVSLDEEWLEMCHDILLHARSSELLTHICRFMPMIARRREGEKYQAKKRGRSNVVTPGGRPKGSIKMNDEKLDLAVRMYCQGEFTVRDICDIVRCNERSMYRYLKLRGVAGMRKLSGGAMVESEKKR